MSCPVLIPLRSSRPQTSRRGRQREQSSHTCNGFFMPCFICSWLFPCQSHSCFSIAMSRTEFSVATRKAANARATDEDGNLRCEECGCIIGNGMTVNHDHILPDALGGRADLDNCQVLCVPCHRHKTKTQDRPPIYKADRIQNKRLGVEGKSRPIPGTHASGIKKPFNRPPEFRE